jgi:outer membrane protein OmpA-like peptidoglycan-associated protein
MRLVASRLYLIGLLASLGACATGALTSQKFPVFFQEWSAALDDAATNTVAGAAKWANEHPNAPVTVSGYADPEGSQQANVAMSRTRAQVVVDQLVRDGVARGRIRQTAHGPTDYTLSSIESRRVEIAVAIPR